MRPPEDIRVELVRQWLAKADADIQAADALLRAGLPSYYSAVRMPRRGSF
jgi:hypothetical protein